MRWVDVSVTRAAFAAGALVLLLLAVADRFGYSSLKGLVILAVIVIVAGFAVGPGAALGAVLAFVAYLVLDRLLADAVLAAAVVAILALVLILMERRGVTSLSRRRR